MQIQPALRIQQWEIMLADILLQVVTIQFWVHMLCMALLVPAQEVTILLLVIIH